MAKKRYIITGVSSGIGYQVSKDLLLENHEVVGISRKPSAKVKQLQEDFPDSFFFEPYDLSRNIDQLPKQLLELAKQGGQFNGLVHAAGIQQTLPLRMNNYAHMLDIFNINLFAGLALARGIADRRVNAGANTSIVFISSIAAKTGSAGLLNYSASKAALNGAMRALAKELSPLKIRVNSVLPGFVQTEMIDQLTENYGADFIAKMTQAYPLGIGEADDISNMITFLLNEKSKWITGCEFDVNGGATLGGQ